VTGVQTCALPIWRVKYHLERARDAGLAATLTLEQWLVTIAAFNGLCAYCKHEPFCELDHVRPVTRQGGTTGENCVPACALCNASKNDFFPKEDGIDSLTLLEKVELVCAYLQIRASSQQRDKTTVYLESDLNDWMRTKARQESRRLKRRVEISDIVNEALLRMKNDLDGL